MIMKRRVVDSRYDRSIFYIYDESRFGCQDERFLGAFRLRLLHGVLQFCKLLRIHPDAAFRQPCFGMMAELDRVGPQIGPQKFME